MSRLPEHPPILAPAQRADDPRPCTECLLRCRTDAFLQVADAELQAIEDFRDSMREARVGEAVIAEHERSTHLYTLYAGWAFRFKTLADGRRQILHFLLPGDLVGLQDEFAEGHTHGVEAATDVRLCAFPREQLWRFFNSQPKLGYDITWLAAREEKMLDDTLVSTGRRNAAERVAMLLMHLFRRAERLGLTEGRRLAFPFNQQHIADALGLSLVHTNKTLRKLQRAGLHTLEGGVLEIINPHALERLGSYFERPVRPVPLL